ELALVAGAGERARQGALELGPALLHAPGDERVGWHPLHGRVHDHAAAAPGVADRLVDVRADERTNGGERGPGPAQQLDGVGVAGAEIAVEGLQVERVFAPERGVQASSPDAEVIDEV